MKFCLTLYCHAFIHLCEEFININDKTKNITVAILKKEYLKYFSTKFYQALIDLEANLFTHEGKKNS